MTIQSSLFDSGDGLVLARSTNWLNTMLFGEFALGLCVLAVALFGFALLSGRISVARSWMTVVGCFVLIGAPGLAASLMGLPSKVPPQQRVILPPSSATLGERPALPPAASDPYAGASLRKD